MPKKLSMTTSRHHPVFLRMKERKELTSGGIESAKQTFHISLDLAAAEISFEAGDSLGVFAQNDPTLVQHILQAMGVAPHTLVTDPRSQQPMSLLEFLTHKANLSRVTSSFLRLFHTENLLEEGNREALLQYLATHDPLDLFRSYKLNAGVSLQEVCAQFGPLLPRFYSVASSLVEHPSEVHLLVAVSTFTHSGEIRFGVASHFLCHLAQSETPIPVYVQPAPHFSLPQDPHTPIIMVGPGTGVAPFRAFLQERIARGAPGKNWLFFGEQHRAHHYFYQDFFEELVKNKQLELDLAFSRDQVEKIYVQHRMQEKGAQLWRWLQEGAYFYVCGDADKMAKDVEHALHLILQEHGGLNEEGARDYIRHMRKEKRYLADVY